MPNNGFNRDVFSLKASAQLSKRLTAEAGASYAASKSSNPTRQGGDYTNENVGRKWIYIFPVTTMPITGRRATWAPTPDRAI